MRVGIKSGCFTLIHSGHIWCLEQCKKHCDYLIVLTNSDEFIKRKKGNCPISLNDRLYILSMIKGVDEVDWFDNDTEHMYIEGYKKLVLNLKFGNNAKLTVFHSDELRGIPIEKVPGYGIADDIIFIDKLNRPESVSKIYRDIKKV